MDTEKIVESAASGCMFAGCAFTTAAVILAGIWVIKVLWKAVFG